jgi:uncharacterized protein (TIGR02231 family)
MHIFPKVLLSFTLLVFQFSTAQKEISSSVQSVTIYNNQAQVYRTTNVQLKKGENKLVFFNLENNILGNSIKISATENATILGSFIRSQQISTSSQPKTIQTLLTKVEKAEKEQYLKQQKINNLKEEKQVILQNKKATGESGFELSKLEGLTAYYRKSLNEIDRIIYDDEQALKEIEKELEEIRIELQNTGYRTNANALNVTLVAERDMTVPISLNYVVRNVGWTPFYEMKSDGVSPEVKSIYKANIFQNTGVNWEAVDVTLSTAQPLINQSVPEVHPWVLRFYQEINKRFKPAAQSNRAADFGDAERAEPSSAGGSFVSQDQMTTAVDNITSREFAVNVPLTIGGNNGKSVMKIDEYILKGDYKYLSVPKYNSSVFLTAYITDWEKYNLLPGTANLYLGKDFVGTTFISPNQDSDSLQLPLGKDDGVIIKRERINDMTKRSFIGRFKTVEMGIRLTVKNNKSIPISINVKDQVPISSDEEIEITVTEISKAQHNETTGELSWDENLEAAESKTYEIRYSVKYPKNKKLFNF